jgi:hypothetical protein
MKFPPICAGEPARCEDGTPISGVAEGDHRWVQGDKYIAPDLDQGQPARWEELVCEKCGAVFAGWQRIKPPEGSEPWDR